MPLLRKFLAVNAAFRSQIRSKYSLNRLASLKNKNIGDGVKIQGWVENKRKMKKNVFIDITDGSCTESIQVVLDKVTGTNIDIGDSIEVIGKLATSPQGKFELQAELANVIGPSRISDGYPFTPKQFHLPEYVRDYLHLRSRVGYMASIFRIRHKATKFIFDFMDDNGLVNIHTPIITTNDCEGAGEVFTIKPENNSLLTKMNKHNINLEDSYFDKKVFLSVSGQLCLEAMSYGLGNTFTFAPAFRAENSKSPLHLSEFYMLEAEFSFVKSLEEVNNFINVMIKTVTEKLLNECESDLVNCLPKNKSRNYSWVNNNWPTITYNEALQILLDNKSKLTTELKPNEGFSKEQELFLVQHANSPVFVVDWPKAIKPFYMKEIPTDPSKVYAVDLLMPEIGEIAGGSLREDDYNKLKQVLPKGLEWYLDLRKYGNVPTGGFGLGFERYLQLITGIKNIRDVIPFPRYPHSCQM